MTDLFSDNPVDEPTYFHYTARKGRSVKYWLVCLPERDLARWELVGYYRSHNVLRHVLRTLTRTYDFGARVAGKPVPLVVVEDLLVSRAADGVLALHVRRHDVSPTRAALLAGVLLAHFQQPDRRGMATQRRL